MTELETKTERLTRLAADERLAGILLASQASFSWLTGGRTNRIDGSREAGNGALFVRADGRRYVIANRVEMPRLLEEALPDGEWEPVEYPWIDDQARPGTPARLAADAAGADGNIGSDVQMPGVRGIDQELTRLRAPLTREEVERYRALGHDAGAALGRLCRTIRPGIAETAIARGIADAAASIDGRAIVVLVAADARIARYRHPVPTSRVWRDTVMLVACIQREGLVVALSRMVAAAAPSEDLVARTRSTAAVFETLLAATRPGACGRDLFASAARAYASAGFPHEERLHHQGGAIGYRSRDWIAHPTSAETVQTRQGFAWNPSITGTKVEETALLTDDGIEVITRSPGWPLLDENAPDILRLF